MTVQQAPKPAYSTLLYDKRPSSSSSFFARSITTLLSVVWSSIVLLLQRN